MEELPILGDAPLKEAKPVEAEVAGFAAAAAAAGIRKDGRVDLALIAADEPVPAAGIFTRNRLAAAPVQLGREHLRGGRARAILANSGCANAATGQPGLDACLATCRAAARALGCRPEEVLPCSTGVIGQLLPAERVAAVLPGLAAGLSPAGIPQAAFAIRTTDAFTKLARADLTLAGRPARVVGLAKGAGMIRPDMATLLVFLLTDAAAAPEALAELLPKAAGLSFNRVSVDGDTSTNDTLLLLASGRAGNPLLAAGDPALAPLEAAVTRVCQELAAMVVADGEGAGHLIRVRITGAPGEEAARHLAFAVAHSQLCKTAFAGCDPNWGRILCAAGAESARRGLPFQPEKTTLFIGEAELARAGLWRGAAAEELAAAVMKRPRYEVRLDLGLGTAAYWVLTSDLDHEYIRINADYRS